MKEIDGKKITGPYMRGSLCLKNLVEFVNKDCENKLSESILKCCIEVQKSMNDMMYNFTETLKIMNNNSELNMKTVEKEMERIIKSMLPSQN